MFRLFLKLGTLLDLCVSSLRRGHANLLCIVPILSEDSLRLGFRAFGLGVGVLGFTVEAQRNSWKPNGLHP